MSQLLDSCIANFVIECDLPPKTTNARLFVHFDKQAKALIDHCAFTGKAAGFQSLLRE